MTVIIVGGGASGLTAAVAAAGGAEVLLLERQSRVGRKLMASGNGRCNLSNMGAGPGRYHGADPAFCQPALTRFGVGDTLDFFAGLGLVSCSEPDGRVYPFSDTAGSVVDALRLAAAQLGVDVRTGCEVTEIRRVKDGFLLRAGEEEYRGDRLIVACGGAAGARLGGGMSGYRLLESLGHRRGPIVSALTQIKTDSRFTRPLKGVRAKAALALSRGKTELAQTQGEVQFTDFGVSGPAAFDLSRTAATETGELTVHLDLLSALSREELAARLRERKTAFPALASEHLLTGALHNRLALVLLRQAGLNLAAPLSALTENQLDAVTSIIKDWRLPVLGVLGFDAAQVTAGGILTRDFDP
ncbi:MAG: aminoacetone oxidase family FAD-binding enzyme, partial [Firmicutes bacterium]|nr:aminoacetone oxidase family FAD-binding enzyme [Bacillota bacterium]